MRALILILAIYSTTSIAATLEEMQAAVQIDERAHTLAEAVTSKKRQLDSAIADYTSFRTEHPNMEASQQTAPVVAEADGIAGLKSEEGIKHAKEAADRAKSTKVANERAASAAVEEKRSELQRRLIVAKNRVKIAENALVAAQAEHVANGGSVDGPPTRTVRNPNFRGNNPNDNSLVSNNDGNASRARNGIANNGASTATTSMNNREMTQATQSKYDSARTALQQAQDEQRNVETELQNYDMQQERKKEQKSDRPDADTAVAPPPPAAKPASDKKPVTTYTLVDGTKIQATSSVDSGDVYVIKTSSGVKTIKKADVTDVTREE